MSYSQASLINKIRHLLNDYPRVDLCTEAMDASETGLDVADGTLYEGGVVVEFQDTGEQCLVTAVASNTLTVIRGYNGTTAASHSINAQITTNPTFPYIHITDAISGAINGLYPYVYKEVNDSFTPTPSTTWYGVATNSIAIRGLSSVTQVTTGTPARVFYYGTNRGAYPVELVFNIPTSVAANGMAYYLPYANNYTNTVNINGLGPVTDTVATGSYSDLTEGVQTDCISYLAVARLVASTDVSRTTQEDIGMGDESVSPLKRTQVASYWEEKGLRERRKWELDLKTTLPHIQKWGHY